MRIPPLAIAALCLAIAVLAQAGFWWQRGQPVTLPEVSGERLRCVSYSPFRDDQTPLRAGTVVTPTQIREDLAQLRALTECVRIYTTGEGLASTVPIAREFGLKVLLGAWIGGDSVRNDRELERTIQLAVANPDVVRAVIVGNEVLLRREQPVGALAAAIDRVRARVKVPVTYADVTEFWLRNPSLAAHVDFVTIHILPYWEDEPIRADRALARVAESLADTRVTFPGMPILIGETGWPSAGRSRRDAVPSRLEQARYVRNFLAFAAPQGGLDYNLIEAFDQPWKRNLEGTVGGHWGLIDRAQGAKFPLHGDVSPDPDWPRHLLAGLILAAVLFVPVAIPIVRPRARKIPAGAAVEDMANDTGKTGIAALRLALAALVVQSLAVSLVLGFEMAGQAVRSPLGWVIYGGGLLGLIALAPLFVAPLAGGRPTAIAPAGHLLGRVRACVGMTTEPAGRNCAEHPGRDVVAIGDLLRGILAYGFLAGNAAITVALAVDPRYRDFPLVFFLVPALTIALAWIRQPGGGGRRPRREERALAVLGLAAAAVLPLTETLLNVEALIWGAVVIILAAPHLVQGGGDEARCHYLRRRAHPFEGSCDSRSEV